MLKRMRILILAFLIIIFAVGCTAEFNGEKDLKRDAFETNEQFTLRIKKLKPQIIGEVQLIKDKYEISSNKFPLKVTLKEWVSGVLMAKGDFFITVNPKQAKSIYQGSQTYPLYARLIVNENKISITALEIHAKGKKIPITIPSEAVK